MAVLDPEPMSTTTRYQKGLTPIRIRTRKKWLMDRNSLHHHRLWNIVHDHWRWVTRKEIAHPALIWIRPNIVMRLIDVCGLVSGRRSCAIELRGKGRDGGGR